MLYDFLVQCSTLLLYKVLNWFLFIANQLCILVFAQTKSKSIVGELTSPGIEPEILGVGGRILIHWATEAVTDEFIKHKFKRYSATKMIKNAYILI